MANAQSPLTKLGYNMVAWPKSDIKPLALLYKTTNGVSEVGAYLKDLFKIVDVAPPRVIKNVITTDIKGTAALTFDGKGGINILDWLLNKLNLGKLSADIILNDSYIVVVSYLNVKLDKVNLLDLDNYISNSEPAREEFITFKDKLENNELFIISAVAKSNDISVIISAKNGEDVSLDANIKGIMDANLSAARKQDNAIELVYKTIDDKPVIFALKAQQIIYERASFWKSEPARFYIKDQVGLVVLDDMDFPTRPLLTGDELINL